MTVPHVLAAPSIVARTDLVCVMAERIARLYASELDLIFFNPPIDLPEFTVSVLTSAARAGDPGLEWLQRQVTYVCKSDA